MNTKTIKPKVEEIVTRFTGQPFSDDVKCRRRELVWNRQLAITIMLNIGFTQEQAGAVYGKNHATALHAKRTVYNVMETDYSQQAVILEILNEGMALKTNEPTLCERLRNALVKHLNESGCLQFVANWFTEQAADQGIIFNEELRVWE